MKQINSCLSNKQKPLRPLDLRVNRFPLAAINDQQQPGSHPLNRSPPCNKQ